MDNNNINEPKGRLVINCTQEQANNFFNRLKKIKEITLKSYKKATDTVFQERYSFTADIMESISVVYETRSNTLIITASDHILSLLKSEFESAQKSLAEAQNVSAASAASADSPPALLNAQKPQKPQQMQQPRKQQPQKPQQQPLVKQQSEKPKEETKQQVAKAKQAEKLQEKALPQAVKPQTAIKPQATAKQQVKQQAASPQVEKEQRQAEEKKEIRGVSRFKLETMLGKISSKKDAECVTDKNSFREGCEIYTITSAKSKLTVRYYADKFLAQLSGKSGKFFDEILGMLTTVAKVSIEEGELKAVYRKLKKILPNAFDVLSEQSMVDFSIGMIDINNDNVRLSDYSMLLVPPYRGLESLISDLQKEKGIDVKMIGQAYEKLEGKYVLKSGYRKRVNSHVYAEVMSALYAEYFEKRNFYAHSDITGDSLSRIISDKSTVKAIFNSLIELLEYNIFKLKEIGFWQK